MSTCPGCGTEHHWLACPEVSQSVFYDQDDEWAREELAELEDELRNTLAIDPEVLSQMMQRAYELYATLFPVGPLWDPATPE